MKQIDLGGLSFANLREYNMYYVDKTGLIKDILESDSFGVYLFTRPRRFGKTTNLSMLDAFFNIKYKGNTWFDGLEISNHPEFDGYRNRHPVIRLNLGHAKADDYDGFISGMIQAMNICFEPHRQLLSRPDLSDSARRIFKTLEDRSISESDIVDSIRILSLALTKAYGEKPIILIDEYDAAISDSFGKESHRPVLSFLRKLLYSSIKGNDCRGMVYMTGVMRIAKSSIFSDLNNVSVYDIFSEMGDERFGFTESEVRELFSYYGHPEKFDEAREWYDGYRFGNAEVYNPYSIMNYVSRGFKPGPYWIDSGSTSIISDLLWSVDSYNFENITNIVTGGSIDADITPDLAYDEIGNRDEYLYSLMVMSGYLKAEPLADGRFRISIPNGEVHRKMDRMLSSAFPDTGCFGEFIRATLEKDEGGMERTFQEVLLHGNYLNLKENAYEIIMMTLMHSLVKRYDVRTEHKCGFGRADIVLLPKHEGDRSMIFELKVSDSVEKLEDDAKEAIEQIRDRRYRLGLKGEVVLYGISFYSKTLKVLIETTEDDGI